METHLIIFQNSIVGRVCWFAIIVVLFGTVPRTFGSDATKISQDRILGCASEYLLGKNAKGSEELAAIIALPDSIGKLISSKLLVDYNDSLQIAAVRFEDVSVSSIQGSLTNIVVFLLPEEDRPLFAMFLDDGDYAVLEDKLLLYDAVLTERRGWEPAMTKEKLKCGVITALRSAVGCRSRDASDVIVYPIRFVGLSGSREPRDGLGVLCVMRVIESKPDGTPYPITTMCVVDGKTSKFRSVESNDPDDPFSKVTLQKDIQKEIPE